MSKAGFGKLPPQDHDVVVIRKNKSQKLFLKHPNLTNQRLYLAKLLLASDRQISLGKHPRTVHLLVMRRSN